MDTVKKKRQDKEKRKVIFTFPIKQKNWKTFSIIVAIIGLSFVIIAQSLTIIQLRYQMAETKEDMLQINNEKKVLTEKIQKIGNDQYVGQIAREKLGLVKSGESPVKVVEQTKEEKDGQFFIESKDKVSIYMKDWYEKLDKWVEELKK